MRMLAVALAMIDALCSARFILRLFAARPDNPGIALIAHVTQPIVGIFAWLDAGQPLFGARLEFSTLTVCTLLTLACVILTRRAQRSLVRSPHAADESA